HTSNKSNPHGVTKSQVGLGSVANIDQSKAIKSITRSGTTFTATALDGSTMTFTQQDNNTTYSAATASSAGLMSAADKSKLDGIESGATSNLFITAAVTMAASSWSNGEYSFESSYPVANYDLEISPNGDSITSDQMESWNNAQIVGSAVANKAISKGTVPVIDIPIILIARRK
ncbi:MAG: hypothetical protein PUJ06_12360, partial [Stecheria intestinalis]|nr:hypothetical protein [Stecheria intestinalis]